MKKPEVELQSVFFSMPDDGNVELSLTAKELTLIACSMANMSYELTALLVGKMEIEGKLKTTLFVAGNLDDFNALAVRLTKIAHAMGTKDDL